MPSAKPETLKMVARVWERRRGENTDLELVSFICV